jgi:two-component system, chemotaxis family, sensor kinase CheA
MSDANHTDQFFSEFIDELYAETDERLELVRRDLLSLETFVDKPSIEQTLLDALLRHFHTLKGLAGSISLKDAEELTHQMENYLRAIRQEQITLSHQGISALIAGTQILEQSIAAHRTQSPLPTIASIMTDLATLISDISLSQIPTVGTSEEKPPPTPTTRNNIIQIWQFAFVPTAKLAERGINVNLIRAHLEEMGTVIQAMPRLTEETVGLAFDFLVETDVNETTFADWCNDHGLTYTLHDPDSPFPNEERPPSDEFHLEKSPPPSDGASLEKSPPSEAHSLGSTTTITTEPLLASSNMVRVDMARLDELMRLIGDLVISRARQANNLNQIKDKIPIAQWRSLQETNLAIEHQLRDLRDGVMRVRLVPIGTAFERMKFVIRDILGDSEKSVDLELSGQETEIDKFVVDKIIDPLLHLVRNAVSHGIEFHQERQSQNKPKAGKITLRAYTIGDAMIIEVEDDGRGIEIKRVTEKAYANGLINEAEENLNSTRLLEILCLPGFTTQEQADLTSGRGVGMDVVKNTINELGGFLTLDSQLGIGTRFTIQLPLTLAIADALIVSVSGQRFAVPRLSVDEVIEIEETAITILESHQEIISHRGKVLPLIRLVNFFHLKEEIQSHYHLLIVGNTNNTMGLIVDRILGEREIVVRALHDPLIQVPGITGASELGDGQIVLIIDVAALIRTAQQ